MSTSLNTITIESRNYTLANDIISACPIWCKGIRNGKEFVKKKKLESQDYIYARQINGEWQVSDGSSNKYDKALIRNIYLNNCENYCNEINKEEEIVDLNGIEKAPPLINLKDSEKFVDDEGWILEIETRGKREHDKIYFKVKDVSEQFDVRNLQDTLLRNNSKYYEGSDYKYFICEKPGTNWINTNRTRVSKEMFLTYDGLLRVIYVTRKGNTKKLREWASKTLFTVQMGTAKQKSRLVSDILGVPINDFNNIMLKPNTKVEIASIYFVTLGTGKDLRKSMDLDETIGDKDIIGLYGFTKDLRRRLNEYKNDYKDLSTNIAIKYYSFVDKSMLSKAEKDIREYFNANCCHMEYETENEMVCIDNNTLKFMESHYQTIGKKYEGDHKDIIDQMKQMEHDHKLEIKNMELQIKNKELQIKDKDQELMEQKYKTLLLEKDKELLELKLSQYE